jgi:hypothetical protein
LQAANRPLGFRCGPGRKFPGHENSTNGIDQEKSGQVREVPDAGQKEKEGGPNAIPTIIGVIGVMTIAAVIAAVIYHSMTYPKQIV